MRRHLSSHISGLYKDFIDFSNEQLEKYSLTSGLLYFILYIGKHPDCSPSDVSMSLHYDAGHTTRSLEKLCTSGFILRERSLHDKRSSSLKLTPLGEEAFSYSYDLIVQWESRTVAELSDDEVTQLFAILKKINPRKEGYYDKRG